jgi:intein/homing endonuclease
MAIYSNFQSKNKKHIHDRYDIYESEFETPFKNSDYESDIIDKYLFEFAEFCSILKFYPDIFWDLYKPEIGGLTFDLHQRVMIRLLSRFPENYFCAPRGISKCVTGDTYLFTDNGITTIGDCFNNIELNNELYINHNINILNKNSEIETSNYGVISGFQKTKRIKTEEGYEIEGTYNHPLLCMNTDGKLIFKTIDTIQIGDYLAISRNNNIWGKSTELNLDMENFLNSISNQEKYELSQRNFHTKEIPDIIMKSSKKIICSVLRSLFDIDGCVTKQGVEYCIISEKMSKQIQILLLNLGIISHRKLYINKKKQYYYKIYINSENVNLFKQHIGFSSKKKQKELEEYCIKNKNTNRDIIPFQLNNIQLLNLRGKLKDSLYNVLVGNNNLTYDKLNLILSNMDCFDNDMLIYLNELCKNNYFYSKVEVISDSQNYVYDLQMPKTNSFIGNGFINHNTLIHVMSQYHTACCFPGVSLSITASTKEQAVKIWKDKHDEILKFYPSFADNIMSARFSKDSGEVRFVNNSVVDNLANSQQSKGLRRHRGGLEESALIDKDTYDDCIEPIFNIGRTTITGENDPEELNGQINRYSTSGYKNSDEYEKILNVARNMIDLKGSFVFGSDWFIPVHFGRQKKSTIDRARKSNIIRFRQNYLCDWVGASDGGLINISKLMKARTINIPQLESLRDKRGNLDLEEFVIGVDVARSSSENNNKTAIVVLKIIRNQAGSIRQVHLVNIITPPNGLNYEEQSVIVKRVFYKYGGNLDLNKSRVKAIVVDGNTIGQGLVEKLLEDVTDFETNEELGCFATINTDDKSNIADAPPIVYVLKSQGINGDIIRIFVDYVESNKLKLVRSFDDIKDNLPKDLKEINMSEIENVCLQTQLLIDEVANLKLKKTQNSITVEQVVKRVDKDRYSATAYSLFYINQFLEREIIDDEYDFVFSYS